LTASYFRNLPHNNHTAQGYNAGPRERYFCDKYLTVESVLYWDFGGQMALEIEERVTKIEALIAEGEGVNRWERRILRWLKFLLFLVAIIAVLIWASSEFVTYVINRWEYVRHALGW
jgi:hypothetical protein